MSISASAKALLDQYMNVSTKVKLGTLLDTVSSAAAAATGSHKVVYAGKHVTVGGAAAEAITVTGVLATDIVIAVLQVSGGETIITAVPTTNTITVTFSDDPTTAHTVAYQVLRAV